MYVDVLHTHYEKETEFQFLSIISKTSNRYSLHVYLVEEL